MQTKTPEALVVEVHATPLAQETVTGEPPAYPFPGNVTMVPTGPEAGVAPSRGVTTNEVEVVFPVGSVPVNACAPAVVTGMVNEQPKLPVEFVGAAAHAVPPPQETVTEESGAQFDPVNVTTVPTGPVPGITVSTSGITVNVAVAESDAASVALNAYMAGDVEGMLNVQPNDPDAFVVPRHADPRLQPIAIAEVGAKPRAENETNVPTRPRDGLSRSKGATETAVDAVFAERSVARNE